MPKYHMFKSEREITNTAVIESVFRNGKFLTLALCRNNEPYILALNYGYDAENRYLYFHTAIEGLKLEILSDNPRVCGTIIEDHGYIEGKCAHAYRSVVFTGSAEILENLDDKKHGMDILLNHQEKNPEIIRKRLLAREKAYDKFVMMRIKIEDVTGKAGNVPSD
jgi:nitroimidazol reductase NimA-like FMN-containing flavoprotein (pyridoxamine 5'-phosphate oxidase superfamily)